MIKRGRLAIFVVLAVVALPFLWLLTGFSQPPILQPLAFNHQLHVVENEFDCVDCHTGVTRQARATLPTLETCQDCHDDELTGTVLESRLLEYTLGSKPIPWQRIYTVPGHVYFSHRRHVALGDIGCEACHGEVASFEIPPAYPVIPITMDGCMSCHTERQVTNDCLACHR